MKPDDLAFWRDSYRALQSEHVEACPGDERLAALVVGEIEGEAREALADHVVGCRPCSEAYRDLLRIHQAVSAR